jgi:hypothetical protein
MKYSFLRLEHGHKRRWISLISIAAERTAELLLMALFLGCRDLRHLMKRDHIESSAHVPACLLENLGLRANPCSAPRDRTPTDITHQAQRPRESIGGHAQVPLWGWPNSACIGAVQGRWLIASHRSKNTWQVRIGNL